jgi:hypothetical protein
LRHIVSQAVQLEFQEINQYEEEEEGHVVEIMSQLHEAGATFVVSMSVVWTLIIEASTCVNEIRNILKLNFRDLKVTPSFTVSLGGHVTGQGRNSRLRDWYGERHSRPRQKNEIRESTSSRDSDILVACTRQNKYIPPVRKYWLEL